MRDDDIIDPDDTEGISDDPDHQPDDAGKTCRHCGRVIVREDGRWIDPEAPTDPDDDDYIWRETCDRHDTFVAEHEPEERLVIEVDASMAKEDRRNAGLQ